MAEFQLSLLLNASEVRVVKAALLVEIARIEAYARVDAEPEIWWSSLSAARRVLSALSDKSNKHLG
jgi:hypothetical protein